MFKLNYNTTTSRTFTFNIVKRDLKGKHHHGTTIQLSNLSYGNFILNIPFLIMVHPLPLFLYFHLFNTIDSNQMVNINFAHDWI